MEIILFYLKWKKSYDKPRQNIKKQRHYFADKGSSSQSYGFSSSHVWMWELDHKEGWAPKNWCFQIVVLEKTRESPLDCKESKPVNPKVNQSWIFIERTDAGVKAPILWPHDAKSRLIRKDWYWERLKAEEEGDGRGWCGWMASPTQWTWVWASFWRWTGKFGMLQSMGLQSWTQLSNWTITTFLYSDIANNLISSSFLSSYPSFFLLFPSHPSKSGRHYSWILLSSATIWTTT